MLIYSVMQSAFPKNWTYIYKYNNNTNGGICFEQAMCALSNICHSLTHTHSLHCCLYMSSSYKRIYSNHIQITTWFSILFFLYGHLAASSLLLHIYITCIRILSIVASTHILCIWYMQRVNRCDWKIFQALFFCLHHHSWESRHMHDIYCTINMPCIWIY